MTDTVVSDALPFPKDEGIGSISDGDEPWMSAGYLGGLAQMVGTSGYVHSGLTFSGHDAANDQFDLDSGRCYVLASSVSVQSTTGGSSAPSYDATLPNSVPIMLALPSTNANLDVTDSTLNDVWVALDTDGTGPGSSGSVYIRHGNGLSAPSHPSVKIGQVNPDNASADTRANDDPSASFIAFTDSGNDTDSGDDYQLPNAADNIDLQSNGEVLNAEAVTISGGDGVGVPATSSGVSPSFGSWRQVSSSRPAFIVVEAIAFTDSMSNGAVDTEVDESGGTTADYTIRTAFIDKNLSDGAAQYGNSELLLPAGAQYRVVNTGDPKSSNSINVVREFAL